MQLNIDVASELNELTLHVCWLVMFNNTLSRILLLLLLVQFDHKEYIFGTYIAYTWKDPPGSQYF